MSEKVTVGTLWMGMQSWEQVPLRDCNLQVERAGAEDQGDERSGGGKQEEGGKHPQTSCTTYCHIQGLSAVQGKTEVT